jgi:hypothetical protein
MQQDDPEVKAWFGQSFRGLGPYYDSQTRATATGLTFEEQKMLLPTHLGVEHGDKDFRKEVIKFYDSLVTNVPKDGLKLNISLADDTATLSETNLPVNVKEYLIYRHALGHPDVAKDKAAAKRTYGKKYYIHDPEGVSIEASAINTLEDRAISLYMKHKDDPIKTDQILTMMGTPIKGLKHAQKVIALKEHAQKNPKVNEFAQREAFERFIRTVEDKDLEYKYLIEEMIGAQHLRRVGNNIIYAESGTLIGENMEAAVLYFKSPKNSRELNMLKAEYQAKLKKGDAYLPKADPVPIEADADETPIKSTKKAN